MANTFLSLHVHLVFSTKNRERWITPTLEQEIWSYLAGIIKNLGGYPIQIGGMEDHIHILFQLPATIALSDLVKRLKGESSKWISLNWPPMKDFRWQDGYGAFSVGQSQVIDTITYIKNQRTHHEKKCFANEYKAFLNVHGITTDEKYILG